MSTFLTTSDMVYTLNKVCCLPNVFFMPPKFDKPHASPPLVSKAPAFLPKETQITRSRGTVLLFLLGGNPMPVARNGRVSLPARPLARLLAHQHIRMRRDPVPLMLRHIGLAVDVRPGRRPGEVIPPDLDVVVRELAQLVVVHAEQLGLLGRAQMQARDEVDRVRDEQRHDKGPARRGADVRQLHVELPPVVVDPSARDDARVDPVQADDVGCAEEGVGHEAKHPGYAVFGKDVHGVVNLEPVFD